MLTTTREITRCVEITCKPDAVTPTAEGLRSVRLMHLLERIAARFNQAGVPLMALKGAALNLLLDLEPGERPMLDLDLVVRPEDARAAARLLEEVGCLRSDVVFREDFFPKYYYEIEYTAGTLDPVIIDLHARPFRPLRYARLVPDDAMWHRAETVPIGDATVLAPSAEDMLIHLAVHSAIHGNGRAQWLRDMKLWTGRRPIDWDRFVERVASWRMGLPVCSALTAAAITAGEFCPAEVRRRLAKLPAGWRDRLALWHAPRDGANLTASFLATLLTTPGLRFKLGYVRDVLLPDATYMNGWCVRHECTNSKWVQVRRWIAPLMRRLPSIGWRCRGVEVRKSHVHGSGVFTRRAFKKGEVMGRYRGRPADSTGIYVAWHKDASGQHTRHEITGPMRFLNHSCRNNAKLENFRLIAVESIRAGKEVSIDYGPDGCTCDRDETAGITE